MIVHFRLDGAAVYHGGKLMRADVSVDGGRIASVSNLHEADALPLGGKLLIPGLVDVHVHLREPGFFYKEGVKSGTLAAARGGYTDVCAMPNLNPPPDTPEHLEEELSAIRRDAAVRVHPYGCITMGQRGRGELCDFEALRPQTVAFSDDGRGIQEEGSMREAMRRVKAAGGLIAAHCEDESLLHGGCVHEGEYARQHGLKGISSESEWRQVERDLRLAEETGCPYHVCHVSTKESVSLIRQAKARGVDVTCETAPHYLLLCDTELEDDGRFKMNPPIRSAADRDALLEGLLDGTIDILATDHAPHSAEEKARGLEKSLMGVVGLECAFPVLYTGLALTGRAPLATMLRAMTDTPRARFGLPPAGIEPGAGDFAIFDLDKTFTIDPDTFLSKGHATPFAGWRVRGECIETYVGGNCVWPRK